MDNNADALFFYHGNHLSSTQMITDITGSVQQAVLYTPFGQVISEYRQDWKLDTIPRYLFNAKEIDTESSMSYFEARYLTSKHGIFISRDKKFEKYFWLSPYAYCYNNPINVIDPDGKDIIILSHKARSKTSVDGGKTNVRRHPVGHMAILIGNEKKGWTYLSYDRDDGNNTGRGNGGNNFTIAQFNSLDDFKNSEHNTFKNKYNDGKGLKTSHKDADGKIIQRYQDAYQIATDAKTDALMLGAAEKVFDKPWSPASKLGQANNCTTVAEKALDAGGLGNGETTPYFNIEVGGYSIEGGSRNYLPAGKYKGIVIRNPQGKDISNQIKRDE